MNKNVKEMSEEELVVEAGCGIDHRSQCAQTEMTKRLIKAITDFNKKSSFYTKVLIGLTIVIAVLTIVMIFQI